MKRKVALGALFFGLMALISSPAVRGDEAPAKTPHGDPDSYVIGIEDILHVLVWGEPDLSIRQKVRPDGRITVPLINDVLVAGRTPDQVRKAIAEALGKFVRDPNVTVIVDEINSFRVYFLGEVATQGAIQFYRPTRLLQGVATAGGLTEFAKKDITLLRQEFGAEKRIEIDFKRVWAGEPGYENIYLEPGDTLLVK